MQNSLVQDSSLYCYEHFIFQKTSELKALVKVQRLFRKKSKLHICKDVFQHFYKLTRV